MAKVEPSVLGGVNACTEWLVNVVRDGVEEAYNRANPALSKNLVGTDLGRCLEECDDTYYLLNK